MNATPAITESVIIDMDRKDLQALNAVREYAQRYPQALPPGRAPDLETSGFNSIGNIGAHMNQPAYRAAVKQVAGELLEDQNYERFGWFRARVTIDAGRYDRADVPGIMQDFMEAQDQAGVFVHDIGNDTLDEDTRIQAVTFKEGGIRILVNSRTMSLSNAMEMLKLTERTERAKGLSAEFAGCAWGLEQHPSQPDWVREVVIRDTKAEQHRLHIEDQRAQVQGPQGRD